MKHTSVYRVTTLLTLASMTILHSPNLLAQKETGTIRGSVQLPEIVLPQYRQSPSRYGGSMAHEAQDHAKKEGLPEATNVVVFLSGPGLDDVKRAEPKAVLSQRDATFIPHVLPIVKGATVEIVNRDKMFHNVFSLSPVKRFNIGRRPTGEEVPVTFDKAGIVPVFCDIHSHMSAFIVVLSNPMFAQPNDNGSYVIEGVPPGKYTIQTWHERFSAPKQTVTVTAGDTSTVNFTLH